MRPTPLQLTSHSYPQLGYTRSCPPHTFCSSTSPSTCLHSFLRPLHVVADRYDHVTRPSQAACARVAASANPEATLVTCSCFSPARLRGLRPDTNPRRSAVISINTLPLFLLPSLPTLPLGLATTQDRRSLGSGGLGMVMVGWGWGEEGRIGCEGGGNQAS